MREEKKLFINKKKTEVLKILLSVISANSYKLPNCNFIVHFHKMVRHLKFFTSQENK